MDARHTELAKRIGLGHSERIAHLFDWIADDFETDLLLALPANAPALWKYACSSTGPPSTTSPGGTAAN